MPFPTAQSSIEIAASPETVYGLVSDVENLPAWAAETDKCTWRGGATGPAVGAKFRGRNRNKGRVWVTTSTVIDADPGKRFAFIARFAGVATATWRYEIEPTPDGCRVTESTKRLTPTWLAKISNVPLGIADRDKHNQANIERTLAQLKEYAEAKAAERA